MNLSLLLVLYTAKSNRLVYGAKNMIHQEEELIVLEAWLELLNEPSP
jgi:hypothetical protein